MEQPPPDERAARQAKLEALRAEGTNPYPVRFDRTHTFAAVREQHGDLEPGQETDVHVAVAGRVLLVRGQGALTFATLQDRSGSLQLFVDTKTLGAEAHERFDRLVDRGDLVGITGTVMTTRRGELSVRVEEWQILAKSLRPLPEKWKGLTDVDARFRQRYVDLVVNEDARRVFEIRHRVVAALREYLAGEGFIEVETPVLELRQGGASARPFVTHHNALDLDLYLRIALELPLKRLIVGGLERVFEIGRIFRNEGVDTSHNPEFTMLEAYQAYADYHDVMDLTQALVVAAARAAIDTTVVTVGGRDVDLATPMRRAPMIDLIRETLGVEMHPSMPVEDARRVLDDHGLTYKDEWGAGKLLLELYDRKVEDTIVEPTFVLDYPREVSPLARPHRDDHALVERFELVVLGRELCNAYSELNDPAIQRAAFEVEAAAKAAGDVEASDVDDDYLRALEYGMPPTGGLGMGIDRLTMLLAGVDSIREVILFPTLKPEQ